MSIAESPPRKGFAIDRHDPSRIVGYITPEEYIDFERNSEEKHEYISGRVIRVAGGSPQHNIIRSNALIAFANALVAADADCLVLTSDQRVFVADDTGYYPDSAIVCGEPLFDQLEWLRNPTVIIEVISPSTEKTDRKDKFRDYQRIESLRHYIRIDQTRPLVTHFEKLAQGLWAIVGDHASVAESLTLSLNDKKVSIPLSAIYRRTVFAAPE